MRRPGFSLLEVTVAVAVVGVVTAVTVPPALRFRDRWLARGARDDVALLLAAARWRAQVSGRAVTVRLGPRDLVVAEQPGWRLARAVGAAYGATLASNRPTLTYRADGLAAGAANLTAVLARGTARETLRVSRLGRVR